MSESNKYANVNPWTPQDERTAAVVVHGVSALVEWSFIAGWVVPLIAYLTIKDKGPFIAHHTKEALNFSITMVIVAVALAITVIGLLFIWLVPLYACVMRVLAAVKAYQGEFYKFPLTFRFIK